MSTPADNKSSAASGAQTPSSSRSRSGSSSRNSSNSRSGSRSNSNSGSRSNSHSDNANSRSGSPSHSRSRSPSHSASHSGSRSRSHSASRSGSNSNSNSNSAHSSRSNSPSPTRSNQHSEHSDSDTENKDKPKENEPTAAASQPAAPVASAIAAAPSPAPVAASSATASYAAIAAGAAAATTAVAASSLAPVAAAAATTSSSSSASPAAVASTATTSSSSSPSAQAAATTEEYARATRAAFRVSSRRLRHSKETEKQWALLCDKVLRNDETDSEPKFGGSMNVWKDAKPIVGLLRRVLESPNFRHYTVRHLDKQFNRSFLIQAIGQYVASNSSKADINALLRSMKMQMDVILAKVFQIDPKKTPGFTYQVNMFPNSKQSRMFALQYALHKKFLQANASTTASATTPSSSRKNSSDKKHRSSSNASPVAAVAGPKPTFYITEGSPLYPAIDRFCWELLLPRDSFRVVNTILAGASSASSNKKDNEVDEFGLPTYTMDVLDLERQIAADIRAGCTPTMVIATLGSEVQQQGGRGTADYQMDDLKAIQAVAQQHQLWIHAEGTGVLLAASTPAAAGSDATLAKSLQSFRDIFSIADSISTEVLGWFDLYGSMTISFLRTETSAARAAAAAAAPSPSSSTSSSSSSSSLQIPGMPLSRDVISNLFLLWFQLVSHEENYLPKRVDELISVSNQFKQRMTNREQLPFPVLTGPTGPHAHLYPHYLFFQVGPQRSIQLADYMLDINSFNAFMFSRIYAHVVEPFVARGYKEEEQHNDEEEVETSRSGSGSRSRSGSEHGSGSEDNASSRDASPSPAPEGEATTDAAQQPHSESEEDEDAASQHSSEEEEESDSDAPSEDEEDDDPTLPLSQSQRRQLLSFLDSSVTLSSHRGRLGFLFHALTSPHSSSCLQSNAEEKHISLLLRGLTEEMGWLQKSVDFRDRFKQAVLARSPAGEIRWVAQEEIAPPTPLATSSAQLDATSFAYGIGAFQYVPLFEVTEAQRDQLNIALYQTLARKTNLYAAARTKGGRAIIIVQSSPIVLRSNAISLVLHEIEESLKRQRLPDEVVASLAKKVEEGIKAAQDKLILDKAPIVFKPTNLIRNIPVVGNVFNWFAGAEEKAGKSFTINKK